MSTVLAIFRRDGEAVDPEEIDAMLKAVQHRIIDGQDVMHQGCTVLAHQHLWITPEEQEERQPLSAFDGRYSISFDGRLDNRQELIERLDLGQSRTEPISDAQIVLYAYVKWKEGSVARLLGDFAFTIWDAEEKELFIARDPLGVRQIAYYYDSRRCVVGTTITPILAHPKVSIALNDSKVAEYIIQYDFNHEESLFHNVYFCPPAHYILITENSVRKTRYWLPNFERRIYYRSFESYVEHFRELFYQAVEARLRFVGKPGSMLSGGMDSSSVTAVVHNELVERGYLPESGLNTYTLTYPGIREANEELEVREFATHFYLNSAFLRVDNISLFEKFPLPFMTADYLPYVMSSAQYRPLCRQLRKDNIRLVFNGAFGDTLLVKERYWTADAVRDRNLPVVRQLLKPEQRFRAQTQVARQRVKDRTKLYLKSATGKDFSRVSNLRDYIQFGIQADFAQAMGVIERTATHPLQQHYTSQADLSIASLLHWSQTVGGLSRMLQGMLDLGIDRWDPFRDMRLVEYILSIPAYVVGIHGSDKNKLILREAMRGILPEETRTRPRHKGPIQWANCWFAGPEGQSLSLILNESLVVQYGYYDSGWIRQRLAANQKTPQYDHELWRCACLELWLRSFGPDSAYFSTHNATKWSIGGGLTQNWDCQMVQSLV